ncbi:nuclear transport factor 2 family protein [Adhaeribacter swui]|uniref:histidine kinase n=1 Tax=Adhaeribacter swui TaxID=2086471 RepID=A0A7G7GBB8_9BACT|nr:ATP-binding protein [Adhaeribacter swui]QNF34452.1 nuclear transport factor 2 family protein [Adhaeribacter swui]
MRAQKEQALHEAYEKFIQLHLGNLPLELAPHLVAENMMIYGTTRDERVFSLKEYVQLISKQRAQSKGHIIHIAATPVFHKTSAKEDVAIIVTELILNIMVEGNQHEICIRLTMVMEFQNEQWLAVHVHASKPDDGSTTEDTWHIIKEWERKNEQLLRLVNEKTGELEQKNRQLEIEAALERVRAKMMSMHKSEELKEVIQLILDELCGLEFNIDSASFVVDFRKSLDLQVWVAAPGQQYASRINLPYIDHPIFNRLLEAQEKEEHFYTLTCTTEEKDSFFDHFFKYAPVTEERRKVMYSSTGWTQSSVLMKTVALNIYNYSGIPFSEEQNNTVMRFGNVFEQTYTRFLDLQKAEEQTKEAQIEAALERVRSRSMAMQKSEELKEVIQLVLHQLCELGFNIHSASFAVELHESNDLRVWVAAPGQQYASRINFPFIDHPIFNRYVEAKEKGEDFYTLTCTKEEKDRFFDHFFKYAPVTEERRNFMYTTNGWTQSSMLMKTVALNIQNYDSILYSEEQNNTLKRFGRVFEQTYTRFLDLQKAEEQAKEAQIEAALERVRSRSMAMQTSEELREVIQVIFDQLYSLHFNIDSASFAVDINESDDFRLWIAAPGQQYAARIDVPYIDHPIFRRPAEAKKNGEHFYTLTCTKEEKDRFYDHFFKYAPVTEERRKVLYSSAGYLVSAVLMKTVALTIYNYSAIPYSDEQNKTLMRFGKAFEQTYTRFLDLQKAEAAAKEAVRQASVDRVRAEIASMRTTNDLDRIIPLIWNELTILNVPFTRCGVFILSEEEQQASVYLSTPEGEALAAFKLPFSNKEFVDGVLHYWRKNQLFIDHWDAPKFAVWTKSLLEASLIKKDEKYSAEKPPENLYLHFVPFLQGMLYVGNTAPLTEDEISLVQSLANAFSTAYARYEDFTKLENAKQQIEKTLLDLKSAQAQLIQKEKMASLGELTAGIAHEIMNPLNFINNFSEVSAELLEELKAEIQNGDKQESLHITGNVIENLQKINHHGKRADAIVKGMLEHSRISSGQKEPTDINALTDEYLRLSYHGLRSKNKDFNAILVTAFDNNLGKIEVNPLELGRVLVNVFNNAFYATQQKKTQLNGQYQPEIKVSTSQQNGNVEIRVWDNGVGIPENLKNKIFQPFFTTKPTGQGTGLGLSLSYDIITKGHNGFLKVNSIKGEFTEFIVSLPANPSIH